MDLALFFLDGLKAQPTFQISERSPVIGEYAWMVGFPSRLGGNYRETRGRIESTNIVGLEYQFDREALDGESGGPLFTGKYQISGIVSASDRGETLVTTVPKIRKFLAKCIKPREPAVQPSPGIDGLLKRIALLEAKFTALESRKAEKGDRGDKGEPGPLGDKGDRGEPGTITVILIDGKGNEIGKAEDLDANDVVRIPITRFLKEK